jgi:hypothetical protein
MASPFDAARNCTTLPAPQTMPSPMQMFQLWPSVEVTGVDDTESDVKLGGAVKLADPSVCWLVLSFVKVSLKLVDAAFAATT